MMRTESNPLLSGINVLPKTFPLEIPDRRPFAQLRMDREALQKRVKDLKTELATLRQRQSYGKRD
jgi:hypothetical protein